MARQRIDPQKITKPIQLLAAWLVGLVLTNGTFLAAAIQIAPQSWERQALIVSAIVNVPLFLLALFILQTRFRPELQEDTFYAEYLSKKTGTVLRMDKDAAQDIRIKAITRALSRLTQATAGSSVDASKGEHVTTFESLDWSRWGVALNGFHPRWEEVREALRTAKIPLKRIFVPGKPPREWIIALNDHLPLAHKVHLLRAVLPLGFDGIHFWDAVEEPGDEEDVYIGSYAIKSYAKITAELPNLLTEGVEEADLDHYYIRNIVRCAE